MNTEHGAATWNESYPELWLVSCKRLATNAINNAAAILWERSLMQSIKCKWREAAAPCKADMRSCEPGANLWLKKGWSRVDGDVCRPLRMCATLPQCWEWGWRGWEWGRHLEWIWGEPEKAWRPLVPPANVELYTAPSVFGRAWWRATQRLEDRQRRHFERFNTKTRGSGQLWAWSPTADWTQRTSNCWLKQLQHKRYQTIKIMTPVTTLKVHFTGPSILSIPLTSLNHSIPRCHTYY